MKFSELSRAITEAEKKIGLDPRECPYCKNTKWSIASSEKYIATFRIDRNAHGMLPAIVLVCNKCGNTLILNPDTLGLDQYLTTKIERDEP